ncbi:MAG: ABC transporter permease [Lachnospiraceae bacterium]|nr:ABC transporter permease [Lachnospiraceae bacterium]
MNYLSIELKKTKRRGIWLVLAALLLVIGAWMTYSLKDDQYLDFGWMMILYDAPLLNAILIPTAAAVFASRIIDMEHKGNTWKLLETMQSKAAIYFSKILYGFIGILIFCISELLLLLLIGAGIGFHGMPDAWAYLLFFVQTLVITFNLFLLQMIVSLVFHNQAAALCTGLCGSMAGLFLMYMPQWPLLRCIIPWGHYGASMFVGMDWSKETRIMGFYYFYQENSAAFFIIGWLAYLLIGGWLIFEHMDTDGYSFSNFRIAFSRAGRKTPPAKAVKIPVLPVEMLKVKRTPIWLAFILLPSISAFIGTFNYLSNLDVLQSTWHSLWTQHSLFFCYFFLPPLIGVYASYLWRLEHNGANWNMVMVNTPAWRIVFNKVAMCSAITFLTLAWLGFLFIVCGKYAGITEPIPTELIDWLACGFAGGIAVCTIQCFLSLIIRSFAVPIGIALLGGIAGLMVTAKGWFYILPYSLLSVGMRANNPKRALDRTAFGVSCVLFITGFYLLSVWYIRRHDVRTQE